MITRPNDVFPLKVGHCQIISGSGESSIERVVPCSKRGGSVPLATCMACEHAAGLEQDRPGHHSHFLCRLPAEVIDERPSGKSPPAASGIADRTAVSAAMTSNVVCVREDLSIEALTALFLERAISGVPVVNAHGVPVGIVSKTDLIRERYENGESVAEELTESERLEHNLGAGFHAQPGARGTVADIMTPLAFTLYERSSLSLAAALMAFEGVHRVPVVSDEGRVVGVLSSLDVVRWLAQQDGYVVPDSLQQRRV